jgi:carbamoyltransferase
MNILGLSAGYHDAAVTVLNDCGEILFAGHSERYSKQKNDPNICIELMQEVCNYEIDTIAYYERPWKKQLRQLYSGQGIEWNRLAVNQVLKEQLGSWLAYPPNNIVSYSHHLSHAAAGFQTSIFDRATVVVIDAVGEWDTISIYGAEYDKKSHAVYTKLWGQKYPHSIGLFYSAITKRIGLHPLDEEYITMGMAAWGKPTHVHFMRDALIKHVADASFKENLHISETIAACALPLPSNTGSGTRRLAVANLRTSRSSTIWYSVASSV